MSTALKSTNSDLQHKMVWFCAIMLYLRSFRFSFYGAVTSVLHIFKLQSYGLVMICITGGVIIVINGNMNMNVPLTVVLDLGY